MRRPSRSTLGVIAALGLGLAGASSAQAAVTPPFFEATMNPGESQLVRKLVDVPEVPPKLDLVLDVDLSGSYVDDLPNIKALAPGLFDQVRAQAADSRFGLASFVDYPFPPWGVAGDYAFRLDQALTSSKPAWTGAVAAMATRNGNDAPESQLESLYQLASGVGREMPGTVDGDFADSGEIAPADAGFRPDATKVVALTTDAPFHKAGDAGPFAYPGPSLADTVSALNAAGIKVIAIKAPGSGAEMDQVATATGGAVVTTGNTSAEIAAAIIAGLEQIKLDVTATPVGCAPLQVTFAPPSRPDVPGGTTVGFVETIAVPAGVTAADLPPHGVVTCSVRFTADDVLIGVQRIRVHVNRPPDCSRVTATPDLLWPPNHKFRLVSLGGATDPDGDAVALTVRRVTQDEPLNGGGDGDTTPDAQAAASPDRVHLRAERSGLGDGRVYRIAFTGSDGQGGRCRGATDVGVPHDRHDTPVDSGQTVDSFGP